MAEIGWNKDLPRSQQQTRAKVDDKPRAQLVDTLRQRRTQPQPQVVLLSDGADTLRRLQQHIAPEAHHVLDWSHVTMRLTVLGQMIKGAWTDAATIERQGTLRNTGIF